MRAGVLIVVLLLTVGVNEYRRAQRMVNAPTAPQAGLGQSASTDTSTAPAKIDFATQVRPLLESRCTPCHFAGGKLYERLPFDRPETIKKLGTKLFTRIKDEKEQRLISDFLAQQSEDNAK